MKATRDCKTLLFMRMFKVSVKYIVTKLADLLLYHQNNIYI